MAGAIINALAAQTNQVIRNLRRSVVMVHGGEGHGAGVIWDRQGLIVTNDHVVHGGRAIVETSDGRRLESHLLARDRENDLALLSVPTHDLPVAPIGNSRNLRVGELIIAVGHPWGVRETATLGIVSGREAGTWMGRNRRELLQADVALAPGNSGGPLADVQGRVVGIASMVMSPGIALAVPSHVAEEFVAAVRRQGYRMAV